MSINEFLEKARFKGRELANSTKNSYKNFLVKVEISFKKSIDYIVKNKEIELYQYINNLDINEKTKCDKRAIIIAYFRTFPELKSKIFVPSKNEKINNVNKPILITLEQLREKFKTIQFKDKNHKLWFSLLINYDFSLRTDLANVVMKYKDEKTPYILDNKFIIFPINSMEKVENKDELKIELNNEDIELLPIKSEYLLDCFNYKDRNNGYSTKLADLCEIYFKLHLTNNDFRRAHSEFVYSKINKDFIKDYYFMKQQAKLHNHSLDTMVNVYINLEN